MARITETALARQHMTPQSATLFRDSTLDKRLGRTTIAGALNDQVRFRFDREGAPSTWRLVPDNEVSARLLASGAGPRIEQRVHALLAGVDDAHAKSLLNVRGIMLSPTDEAWAAGYQLMQRDAKRIDGGWLSRPFSPETSLEFARGTTESAAAQALWGWVHVAPDFSRNMLTSIGAYSPGSNELLARSGSRAETVGPILAHELQHFVSEAPIRRMSDGDGYAPIAWLEEALATVLSMETGVLRQAAERAWDVSARSHAAHVAAPDGFDVGWKPWKELPPQTPEERAARDEIYEAGPRRLVEVLRLAGVDRRTDAGRDRAAELLQSRPVAEVPEVLAKALLAEHGVRATQHRVELLAGLVVTAQERGGLQRIERYLDTLR